MEFRYSSRMDNLSGSATREILKLIKRGGIISFAGGLPANEMLPGAELAAVSNEILTSPRAREIMQYDVTEGSPSARAELVKYLGGFGIGGIDIDNVQIISGGQQGIDLCCRAFLNKGDTVLVENPTYLAALQIIASYEARAVGIASDGHGLDIADLEAKCRAFRPKLLYVVPTFSNPTGNTYNAENRRRIAELSAAYGVAVIEDDPYGQLRFSGEFEPPIKTYDTAGNVVYLTSFSKIVSPGMRIGAACGDKGVIRKLTVCKQGQDVHTNSLSVAVVEEFLKRGILRGHIAKVLPLYREKQALMADCLDRFMPDCFTYGKPEGGLFIWGEFRGADIDTAELLPAAIAECGAAYVQGGVFFADGRGARHIRLNFSNPTAADIEKGIGALGAFFKRTLAGRIF